MKGGTANTFDPGSNVSVYPIPGEGLGPDPLVRLQPQLEHGASLLRRLNGAYPLRSTQIKLSGWRLVSSRSVYTAGERQGRRKFTVIKEKEFFGGIERVKMI